jgi:protein-tyrosine phosphatase
MTVDPSERDPVDFSVLFICTANQCRSPLAEHLLRSELALRDLSWSVSSAGLQARPGQPIHRSAARILDRRGIDTSDWTSRRVGPDSVVRADLILTATEAHRGAVAQLSPGAMSRTFTLLQFAYLVRSSRSAGTVPDTDLGRSLIARAASARGNVQPLPAGSGDLPDPMGHSFSRFRKCAASIEQALSDVLAEHPTVASAPPSTNGVHRRTAGIGRAPTRSDPPIG